MSPNNDSEIDDEEHRLEELLFGPAEIQTTVDRTTTGLEYIPDSQVCKRFC